MTNSGKKKKTNIIWVPLVFVAFLVTTFLLNRDKLLIQDFAGPGSGVSNMVTSGEKLIALSRDGQIFFWDWNNLYARPKISTVKAVKTIIMSSDRLLKVPSAQISTIILSDWQGDKQIKRFMTPLGKKCSLLVASENGNYAVAVFESKDDSEQEIEFTKVDPNLSSIVKIKKKSLKDGLGISNAAISNDGKIVAGVGEKSVEGKTKGYLIIATEGKSSVYEKFFESNKLTNVIFSPDSRTIYASESGRFIYVIESATGRLVKKYEMDKYETPANNPQSIPRIAISSDGRFFAAATEPRSNVWVWDVESGERIVRITGEKYTVSGVSFSPDSSKLATGVLVRSTVHIWKIPGKP